MEALQEHVLEMEELMRSLSDTAICVFVESRISIAQPMTDQTNKETGRDSNSAYEEEYWRVEINEITRRVYVLRSWIL